MKTQKPSSLNDMQSKPKQTQAGRNGKSGNKTSKAQKRGGSRKGPPTYTITKDEFIMDVDTSMDYTVFSLPINPGLKQTFPWLSGVAKAWEKYRFKRLHFQYRSLVTDYAPNASGRIMLLGDYDALDPPPVSKQAFLDSQPVAVAKPYTSAVLRLSAQQMNNEVNTRFIRRASAPSHSDLRLYDVGKLHLGASDSASAGKCGELGLL